MSQTFHTTMFVDGNNTGIEVPAEVIEALGQGKRVPVTVAVRNAAGREHEYRSTVASMGGRFLIPFSKDKREASGIAGGDELDVTLTVDTAPRTVDVPADFAAALDAAGARAAFDALAPSHQKAHVTAIEGAKAEATRLRRIEAAVAKITAAL